jgi:hypothetical protein
MCARKGRIHSRPAVGIGYVKPHAAPQFICRKSETHSPAQARTFPAVSFRRKGIRGAVFAAYAGNSSASAAAAATLDDVENK